MSAWKEFRGEAEEYRELDDERTLVLHRFPGRGESSGLELEQMQATGATVYHVRANKVVRMVVYFDRDRALADLGLASGAN